LQECGHETLSAQQFQSFQAYLSLLQRWNAKVSLTSIRDEETILRRHFLESIVCARLLPDGIATLLDYGSGAGFPGVPCAICRPEIKVTLAESQAKKAVFLREVVRTLDLHADVHGGRVEDLGPGIRYDAVVLRAVDRMRDACAAARLRVREGGWLVIFSTEVSLGVLLSSLSGFKWGRPEPFPGTDQEVLLIGQRAGD
jgi:16S rRNA (guanine527-N7)-methyltransferase